MKTSRDLQERKLMEYNIILIVCINIKDVDVYSCATVAAVWVIVIIIYYNNIDGILWFFLLFFFRRSVCSINLI